MHANTRACQRQHPVPVCTVTMTVTGVCVSFSHYVDGMIPIVSDRGSQCKHQMGREREIIIVGGVGILVGKKNEENILSVCVCVVSGGSSVQRLSASASVSWLQTSLEAPALPLLPSFPRYAYLFFSTYSPFITCFLWSPAHRRRIQALNA